MKKSFVIIAILVVVVILLLKSIFCSNSNENEISNKIENNTTNIENTNISNEANSNNTQSNIVILNENATVVEKQVYPLDNKTIAFLGDSLIRGHGNDDKGFDYYLSLQLKNTQFVNNSKSGSTITDNSGDDNIIMINQAKTLTGKPDIIVFDGGANDVIGYNLGFLNQDLKKEIGSVDSDSDSVIMDLQKVIVQLKDSYPDAKFCYVQPFLLDEDTISHLTEDENAKQEIIERRDAFYNELPKLCQKWNIDYFDISNQFSRNGANL